MDMTNFPKDNFGPNLQSEYNVNFSPSCVIYGYMTTKQREFLIKKLEGKGLNVAYVKKKGGR